MSENRRSLLVRGLKALLVAAPVVAVVASSAKPAQAGLFRRARRSKGGCSTCR